MAKAPAAPEVKEPSEESVSAPKAPALEIGQTVRLAQSTIVGRLSWMGKDIAEDKEKKIVAQPAEARVVYLEQVSSQTPGAMIHGFDGAYFQVRSLKCLLKDLKSI